MRTVADAMAFITQMSTVSIGAIDKDLLRQALTILMEGAQEKGIDLVSDDPLAESIKAAKALAALLGIIPAEFGDTEVDLSQSLATAEGEGFELPPLPEPELEEIGPRPIGVPFDFVASREVPDPLSATRGTGPALTRTQIRTFEPQYFEGDELAPQSLDPAAIIHLQKRLVAAGLMDEGDYYAGYWTDISEAAYKTVLGVANTNGTDATVALTELIRTLPQSVKDQRARAKQLEKFQADPFIKPDYATLAQDVKTTMRTRLGREPTAAELAELTREMTGFDRQDFEAFTEEQRFAFNRAQGIQPPVTADNLIRPMGVVSGGLTVAPTELQDVDPGARFREMFERRFKPEIDRLDSLDEVRRNTNNVFASLRTMSSLVGGGR